MKNKKILLLSVAVLGLGGLVGCNNGGSESSSETSDKKVELRTSIQYQDQATRIAFGVEDSSKGIKFPYTDPKGNKYNTGDLKPVWKEVSDRLKIAFKDVTPDSSVSNSFTQWTSTLKLEDVDVLQGSASNIQNYATANKGKILDLNVYMEQGKLPNLKKFLDGNKVVKATVTTYDGNVFYAPYFDGYDDLEKTILMRVDMVKKLLDGAELPANLDTADTIENSYTAFYPGAANDEIVVMKKDKSGTEKVTRKYNDGEDIITKQNALGTKNGNTLVQALRDYIDAAYNGYYGNNRSDLFVGENAAYNVDELVALFRCVRTNSTFLGAKEGKIVPIFAREDRNDRKSDLYGLMGQMFGVRGLISKSGTFFVKNDGKLADARLEDDTLKALEKMHEIYAEGLMLDYSETGKYMTLLHSKNRGFCSYDYVQTQTAHNYTYKKDFPEMDFEPVINPTAKWNGSNEFTRFQESWRSVKTEGWCLSGSLANAGNEEKLERALQLIDYFWTDEGARLMSYGPDAYLDLNEDGTYKTVSYMGTQVPKLADETLEQLKTLTNYNYTNYYRYYLGATYPVGYIKEQGMEYQCNVEEGRRGLDKVEDAIALGVIKHPDVKWESANKWDWIVPTTFAFDATAADAVSKNFTTLNESFSYANKKSNEWIKYIQYGFGYTGSDGVSTYSKEDYMKQYKDELKGQEYLDIHNEYWELMHQ